MKAEFKEIVKNLGTERKTQNDSNLSKNSLSDSKIKFKHLVDYYLTSGQDFSDILRTIDSEKIFSTLLSTSPSDNGESLPRSLKE